MKTVFDTKEPINSALENAGLIKIAILAVGGQGGGVLSNWIVDLAEKNGYYAQMTSVPGVAQRTGATIYYIEMLPETGKTPILALMPSPGDVDVVIAAEIMEAGRAVTRGLVTPGNTTMIASSHRMFAVSEKIVPGDGRAEIDPVIKGIEDVSKRVICFDMARIAEKSNSHISACLFGALAGSGSLPFSRNKFEDTIRASGRSVEASLEAFSTAYSMASGEIEEASDEPAEKKPTPLRRKLPSRVTTRWNELVNRLSGMPSEIQVMARAGLEKVVDYQDMKYGVEYLDQLEKSVQLEQQKSGNEPAYTFTNALAKYLANAMCYDDVIRVADLKTRSTRFDRVREDVGADDETIVNITEFMHPRGEEICGLMPAPLGQFVENRPRLVKMVDRLFNRGQRFRSDAVLPFFILFVVAGMRRWRRGLLRHKYEKTHRQGWLDVAFRQLEINYAAAVEVINCHALIKGYSDTHIRGLSKFDRVMYGLSLVEGRPDASEWLRRLREAALSEEKSVALEGVIQTIQSFSPEA